MRYEKELDVLLDTVIYDKAKYHYEGNFPKVNKVYRLAPLVNDWGGK